MKTSRQVDAEATQPRVDDWNWAVVLCAITAITFGLWFIEWKVGLAQQPLLKIYGSGGLVSISIAFLIRFLVWLGVMWGSGEKHPIGRVRQKSSDAVSIVIFASVGALLSSLSASAFTALKVSIPSVIPFWLDHPLMELEGILGREPWQISNTLLGWATPGIDVVYGAWAPTMVVTLAALFTAPPSMLKTVALNAYFASWLILGVLCAYLLSSAGPIFVDPHVRDTIGANGATIALRESSYVWSYYRSGTSGFAAGISAMPSLHVATAVWLALIIYHGWPKFSAIGWAYVAIIWVGSFHLGWHYASDGVVGALGAVLIWRASARYSKLTTTSLFLRK